MKNSGAEVTPNHFYRVPSSDFALRGALLGGKVTATLRRVFGRTALARQQAGPPQGEATARRGGAGLRSR